MSMSCWLPKMLKRQPVKPCRAQLRSRKCSTRPRLLRQRRSQTAQAEPDHPGNPVRRSSSTYLGLIDALLQEEDAEKRSSCWQKPATINDSHAIQQLDRTARAARHRWKCSKSQGTDRDVLRFTMKKNLKTGCLQALHFCNHSLCMPSTDVVITGSL